MKCFSSSDPCAMIGVFSFGVCSIKCVVVLSLTIGGIVNCALIVPSVAVDVNVCVKSGFGLL